MGAMAPYAVTIFISAILLFLVQPLMGKVLLPWFGGSSAVWSAAMLFFQLLLLAGYLYSHLLATRAKLRLQRWIHLGVVGGSLLLMSLNQVFWRTPLTPSARWAPDALTEPLGQVLLILMVSVGLPYFVLATTSPLVQAWFAARFPGRNPYPLYALSNAGSILGLAAFPFLLEPALSIWGQASAFSVGYGVLALLLVALLWRATGAGVRETLPARQEGAGEARRRLGWGRVALWLALSTTGAVLLLGTTTQITANVTTVPLLWVGPLAIYLLTFVLVFSSHRIYSRAFLVLLLVVTQLFGMLLIRGSVLPLQLQFIIYGLTLFGGCMVCHGELARLRPRTEDLTAFYLVQGVGGALGGILVNVAAPAALRSTWELPIALLACWGLAGIALARDKASPIARRQVFQIIFVLIIAVGLFTTGYAMLRAGRSFRLATVAAERNFYGVLRVQTMELGEPPREAYRLVHGTKI